MPEPEPADNELLVRVEAFAPNPGDIAALAGTIPGRDGSGTVLRSAADGRGPRPGDRVLFLGLAAHRWALHRAVPLSTAAPAPADAS